MALDTITVLMGLVISLFIAILAFKREALTEGGTLTAMLIGTLTFVFGGWPWFLTIAAFFVSSSVLSHYKLKQKEKINKDFAKAGARDSFQVTANGILATLLAVAYYFYPNAWLFVAFAGVVATVNADTWATELGVLSKEKPVSILTGKSVRTGTSGAVSTGGTIAGIIGSLFIGALAVFFVIASNNAFGTHFLAGATSDAFRTTLLVFVITLAGVVGIMADSILGATVQVMYFDKARKRITERFITAKGKINAITRGIPWFDNDITNFASSIIGGALAAALYLALGL